jgi:hypothetical protein
VTFAAACAQIYRSLAEIYSLRDEYFAGGAKKCLAMQKD